MSRERTKSWGHDLASVIAAAVVCACSSSAGPKAPSGGCALPAVGDGRARLVNAGTIGATDFCLRASGTAAWGSPLLASGGSEGFCGAGLAYAQATVPFAVPAGSVDVKAVPAGSTCAATATSELDGAAIGSVTAGAPAVTLLRMSGGSSTEKLVALPEEATPLPIVDAMRLVNALSGNDSINMGLVASAMLPATVQANAFAQGIPPGSVPAAGDGILGTTDGSGYTGLLLQPLHLGVSFAAETTAIFVIDTPTRSDRRTLFAIGDPSDSGHPPRGLYCDDVAASSSTDGGANVGDALLLASCALTPLLASSIPDE